MAEQGPLAGLRLHLAARADAGLMRDVERAANLVALAHVFPPDEHLFPEAAVEQRWVTTLEDPSVDAWLLLRRSTGGGASAEEPVALVAHDDTWVRHLAVRPEAWGAGIGSALLRLAADGVAYRGGEPRLWCLRANERARGMYLRRGWAATGLERTAVWAPYPVEIELVLAGPGA